MEHVSVAFAQAFGHGLGVDIDGGEVGGGGVVAAEPEQGAHLVGQVGAGLAHEPEARLLGGDGALVGVGLAFPLEAHRPPAVGQGVAARTDVGGHIHRGALVVVAHHVGHVGHADLLGRLDEEGHFALEVIAHRIVQPVGGGAGDFHAVLFVGEGALAQDVEGAPSTGVAGAGSAEVKRVVGVAETEIRILALVPAQLAGETDHVRGEEAVLGVVLREARDAGLVGVGADVAVGDAAGHPDDAFIVRAFAHEVHHPSFLRVGDGEGLAAGRIAVAVCQVDDDLDGLAGRAGALQGDVDEGAVVHHALGIGEAAAAAPGGLADDELVHVHIADGLPGAGHLLDAAQGTVAVPVADVEHRAGAEAAAGAEIEFTEKAVGIGGVGDHAGAVGTGAGADDHVGTGVHPAGGESRQSQDGAEKFSHFIFYL